MSIDHRAEHVIPGVSAVPEVAAISEKALSAESYFAPFEYTVKSWSDTMEIIEKIYSRWSVKGDCRFAWRGQGSAAWGLVSSLYRKVFGDLPDLEPTEDLLRAKEKQLMSQATSWGLRSGVHGQLSYFEQLAMLQHYGAPTRLLDISFNPLVGLWFAVDNEQHDDMDGRIFAFDVKDKLIEPGDSKHGWSQKLNCPWAEIDDWTHAYYAWKPDLPDRRMSAQNGGFLLGGVPSGKNTDGQVFQWPKRTKTADGVWPTAEMRRFLSVQVRMHKLAGGVGRPPASAAYTLRIKNTAKPDIRKHLQQLYGYHQSTIYPDYGGFAKWTEFGFSFLPEVQG